LWFPYGPSSGDGLDWNEQVESIFMPDPVAA
jgi:hypothetical protein